MKTDKWTINGVCRFTGKTDRESLEWWAKTIRETERRQGDGGTTVINPGGGTECKEIHGG